MAIERDGMVEEAEASETSETASLPLSVLGGSVEPGDVVRLEVVSVEGETATVKYAAAPETGGIDEMSAEFNGA